jgi:SpoVK/Ycf46/Vps4 family AAA+-type ATPase
MKEMDEKEDCKENLAQLARLAIADRPEDIRLFLARLVRKYRKVDGLFALQLDGILKTKTSRSHPILREKFSSSSNSQSNQTVPIDQDSRLSLLKIYENESIPKPILDDSVEELLRQLIQERRQSAKLNSLGLEPTRSAIFQGVPGVGKTLTARWIASQLNIPLFILDLTAVMSSLLGKTGNNLRSVLDFAKEQKCILLLDEIDSIAKRRSDDSDIGELKRLVTVVLQEVDAWPSTGFLLAATNYPDLIDPALWRRFDLVVNFTLPDQDARKTAILRFLDSDLPQLSEWVEILTLVTRGYSFSDLERTIQRLRRGMALGIDSSSALIEATFFSSLSGLDKKERIEIASLLARDTKLSQHKISNITGVSRDTIRKYSSVNNEE